MNDKSDEARIKRAKLVRELDLSKTYQRAHTATGVHRRLEVDPSEAQKATPKVKPEDERSKNLRRRHRST